MAKSKKPKKKSSSVPVWLIVGGVAGGGVILFCIIGMALLLPAIQQAREAARRAQAQQGNPAVPGTTTTTGTGTMAPVTGQTKAFLDPEGEKAAKRALAQNFLKQIGLGCHNFHNVNLHFPPLGTTAKPVAGEMPQAWMTDLLPYMDQQALYASIKRGAAWTDPSQGNAFKTVVPNYLNPAAQFTHNDAGYAFGHYAANSRVISDSQFLSFRDLTDGTSNTMLAGTVVDGYRPWGDPANHRDAAKGFGGGPEAFGAPHDGIALILLADGSVKAIKSTISLPVCQKLADPADGQPLDLDIEAP